MNAGILIVSTARATVALVVRDGIVVDCPPYARSWAQGRQALAVRTSAADRGAHVCWLPDGTP